MSKLCGEIIILYLPCVLHYHMEMHQLNARGLKGVPFNDFYHHGDLCKPELMLFYV